MVWPYSCGMCEKVSCQQSYVQAYQLASQLNHLPITHSTLVREWSVTEIWIIAMRMKLELHRQGTLIIRMLLIKIDNKSIKTGLYNLTFNRFLHRSWKLATSAVDCSYQTHPWFRSQKFGYGKDSCFKKTAGFWCSQKGHDNTDIQKCVNCLGDHMTALKECHVWKKGQRTFNGSKPKAEGFVEGTTPSPVTEN